MHGIILHANDEACLLGLVPFRFETESQNMVSKRVQEDRGKCLPRGTDYRLLTVQ
jgi:hypothetical protein